MCVCVAYECGLWICSCLYDGMRFWIFLLWKKSKLAAHRSKMQNKFCEGNMKYNIFVHQNQKPSDDWQFFLRQPKKKKNNAIKLKLGHFLNCIVQWLLSSCMLLRLRVRIYGFWVSQRINREKRAEAIFVVPDSFPQQQQQKINLKTYFCSCRCWLSWAIWHGRYK